jgi:hypothetical protein
MRLPAIIVLACCAAGAQDFDVVVYGGSPGGIAAALAAARAGRSVALAEYHHHFGGMAASGLGKSDIENRETIGGIFREFTRRVRADYVKRYGEGSENVKLCQDGYYYEPSVAERILGEMIAEAGNIRAFPGHRLREAIRQGNRITGVRIENRKTGAKVELRGKIFIDGTYEGDLAASAAVPYRIGRESRHEFDELHAGVVYQDYETRTFLAGTTGEGDNRVQAYTFRLCLTTDPGNSRPLNGPPAGYDRTLYLGYLEDWKAGRMGATKDAKPGRGYYAPTIGTVVRALSMAELPNRKLDINMNPRPLGFPFAELNYDYPDANWERREEITARIRNVTLGLLYFLQNDSAVPEDHRKLARQFQLARDEFQDNGNFPWQLYVREGRRIVGEYTFSEQDLVLSSSIDRARIHSDSIAAADFPIDSFPVRRREPRAAKALEGYILMLDEFTQPYQLPYRIMVPKRVEGLLVPVAASATHVAFSTIRMEPTWMALGQAAGTAANLAVETGTSPRALNVETLQKRLIQDGQVITFFRDIDPGDPAHQAIQYFGTKGLFHSYVANSRGSLDRKTAREWARLAGRSAPEAWNGDQSLTWADVGAWLNRPPVQSGSQALTRGDFCRILFELKTSAPASAR